MDNPRASSSQSGTDLKRHFQIVADAIAHGRLVPFLGAGVNLCERPDGFAWVPESRNHLPNGSELAEFLSRVPGVSDAEFCSLTECPKRGRDLTRVSQNLVTFLDEGPLYERLHDTFAGDVPPTSVHRFIASLKTRHLTDCRPSDRNLLVVTTNYDDLMERALQEHGQFEMVFYDPDRAPGGRFCHRNSSDKVRVVTNANSDKTSFCENRPVVLKIHGTIDREKDRNNEGFVITEDQYIEYLAEAPLENLLPSALLAKLRNNHLIFLGYSLRDWNFRVYLRRLKRSPQHKYRSWAVLLSVDEAEERFWRSHGVDIILMPLKDYIERLQVEINGNSQSNGTSLAGDSRHG